MATIRGSRIGTFRLMVAVGMVAVLGSACSQEIVGSGAGPTGTVPSETVPTPTPDPETTSPEPIPTRSPAELHGDAATNKTCALATVAEIEELTGSTVWQVDGIAPDARGSVTCVWRLAPTMEWSAPVVLLAWDQKSTDAPGLIDLYRMLIKDGSRKEVPGYGDVGIMDGSFIEVISGNQQLSTTYRIRQITVPADQQVNLAVLKLIYPRAGLK